MAEPEQRESVENQNSQRESKERLAQLCDIWYDLDVNGQFGLAALTTMRLFDHLNKGRKFFVVAAALVSTGVIVYLVSGNWALVFVMGVLFGLVVSWIISR